MKTTMAARTQRSRGRAFEDPSGGPGSFEVAAEGRVHLMVVMQHGRAAEDLEGTDHAMALHMQDGDAGEAEADFGKDDTELVCVEVEAPSRYPSGEDDGNDVEDAGGAAIDRGRRNEQGHRESVEFERVYGGGASGKVDGEVEPSFDGGFGAVCDSKWVYQLA